MPPYSSPYEESYPPTLWAPGPAPTGTTARSDTPVPPAADAGLPDDTWLKSDIVEWLTSAGDAPGDTLTKAELLALVAQVQA